MLAATVASITGEPDVYNIVDDDPLPVAQWMPAFARWVDAPASRRLSAEDALDTAGEEAVYYHTRLSVEPARQGDAGILATRATLEMRPR
uniref:hypothetical protein n=1 Tax=Burkholderia gladioli TaxID=28095 RepID=UPI0034DB19FD